VVKKILQTESIGKGDERPKIIPTSKKGKALFPR
jgi:hypothetical protein